MACEIMMKKKFGECTEIAFKQQFAMLDSFLRDHRNAWAIQVLNQLPNENPIKVYSVSVQDKYSKV